MDALDALEALPAGTVGQELKPIEGAYFAELDVTAISPNPRQPRQVFEEEAMAELVFSIKEVGLLQPVVVRPHGDGQVRADHGGASVAGHPGGISAFPATCTAAGIELMSGVAARQAGRAIAVVARRWFSNCRTAPRWTWFRPGRWR